MPVDPVLPGVPVADPNTPVHPIVGVATSICAFVGAAVQGPVNQPVTLASLAEFDRQFGGLWRPSRLGYAVRDFFRNGGRIAIIVRVVHGQGAQAAAPPGSGQQGGHLTLADFTGPSQEAADAGLYALRKADLFNLLCIPPYTGSDPDVPGVPVDVDADLVAQAAAFCEQRRAMLLVDPPSHWTTPSLAAQGVATLGTASANAAVYYPRLVEDDPLATSAEGIFPPSGAVAGIYAQMDERQGVWKAPAGTGAVLAGVARLTVALDDQDAGRLTPLAVNGLRSFAGQAPVVWGTRTLQGADLQGSQWKYVPVRRMALFLEESVLRGTQWAVFENNAPALWSSLQRSVADFLLSLFLQGAFQGATPQQAWFVRCGRDTVTVADQAQGIVNILVGFAPLKPAEFVVLRIQQRAVPVPP